MIKVNALGDTCPVPVIKAKKELGKIEEGQVEILVDNTVATENLRRLAESTKCQYHMIEEKEDQYKVTITKGEGSVEMESSAPVMEEGVDKSGNVFAIGSDLMGEGEEELGTILMKGFIFAITQLEQLPSSVLFYNKGVFLTLEGSQSLESLHQLKELGVEIFVCGTCLDYYKIKDKLAVGTVTNMYEIVERMNGAREVIRP